MPVILSVTSIIALTHVYSHSMLAMTICLSFDSYFAIRYKSDSDKIKYSPIELFAMESWTQQAFTKEKCLLYQIISAGFIFTQVFLAMSGIDFGQRFCYVLLAFQMARLIQFMDTTILGIQMF